MLIQTVSRLEVLGPLPSAPHVLVARAERRQGSAAGEPPLLRLAELHARCSFGDPEATYWCAALRRSAGWIHSEVRWDDSTHHTFRLLHESADAPSLLGVRYDERRTQGTLERLDLVSIGERGELVRLWEVYRRWISEQPGWAVVQPGRPPHWWRG